MIAEPVTTTLVTKLVETASQRLLQKLGLRERHHAEVHGAKQALADHLLMASRWAAEISFRDLWKPKIVHESFVDLDLNLGPSDTDMSLPFNLKVSDVIDIPSNVVLLGDPGSGKTTSLKKITLSLLYNACCDESRPVPILVRLKELSDTETVFSFLMGVLGISLHLGGEQVEPDKLAIYERRAVMHYLDKLSCILLLDGLDETHPTRREPIVNQIRHILLHGHSIRIILTCRTAEFIYNLENTRKLMIKALNDQQILEFARRWLGGEQAPVFIKKIRENPYSGSEVRPLTLAHLCAIYERSGTVPDKPRTVYRKIVQLFLEAWDEQNQVHRVSRYANFEVDRKQDFLQAIAYHLTVKLGKSRFSHEELEHTYHEIHAHFGLPRSEATKVMREIESHTGLILESGETYEFAHKSIQEYLTAEYILKLAQLPQSLVPQLPNEAALAVALSSNPSEYFINVVSIALFAEHSRLINFVEPFLRRLRIEKVDFISDVAFGLAVILLYSEAYFPLDSTVTAIPPKFLQKMQKLYHEFTDLEPVAKSVADVVNRCTAKKLSGGVYRLFGDAIPFPQALRTHRNLTIDDGLIEVLRKHEKVQLREKEL